MALMTSFEPCGLVAVAELAFGPLRPVGRRTPATLIGTLRRAEPRRCGDGIARGAGRVLLLRAELLADRFGGELGRKIGFGITALSFSSNLSGPMMSFLRMLVFSISASG